MKKIVIDISRLYPAALKRGVGIYVKNLYQALIGLNDGNKYILTKTSVPARPYRSLRFLQDDDSIDLIHYPYFDPFFLTLPRRRRTPIIITVHDLTPLKFPEHYPTGVKGGIKWQIQKYLLKKTDAIITDSKNSKKDIIDIINYPENKIFPIHLAVGEEFKKAPITKHQSLSIKQKYNLPDTFLLYVGDLNWNKNIEGLIKAMSSIINHESSAINLILVGAAFENNNLSELKILKKLIGKLNLKKKVKLLGFVPTQDLAVIYNLAALYIQPSFYEGFGLPVLEAMICGSPVLSSNQASLPEVGGKAVKYFDPNKKGDLERNIRSLLINQKRLEKLEKLGLEQAKKFSWEKTAEQTAKVYQKVFKNEFKA